MIIYIIRHPETKFNKKEITQGWADSSLTTKGKKTAEKLAQSLKNKKIIKIYTSDLGRCIQTSKLISKELKIRILPKKELREQNFGKFNGKSNEIIKKEFDLSNTNLILPNGESFNQMKKRILKFIHNLQEKGPILIVTHDGCLRAILSELSDSKSILNKCNTNSNEIFKFDTEKKKISKNN